ncbi:hypothetical protein KAU11_00270 [Candidatus Babeliales bacterium]|nr:hypothetical protein [Candidatus Babeliales bacterium]
MTYEIEMAKYLRDHELPADEGTYPEELMAQITIKAFDELADRIQELKDELETTEDELTECEQKFNGINDKLLEIKEMVSDVK